MMECFGVDFFGQFECLLGVFDIDVVLGVFIGVQVIDGGEMEEVVDLVYQIVLVVFVDIEQFFGQVFGDWYQMVFFNIQLLVYGIQFIF